MRRRYLVPMWGKEVLIALLVVFCLLMLCFKAGHGADNRFQYEIKDFSGGLDLRTPDVSLPTNAGIIYQNFWIVGPWLEVRPGLQPYLIDSNFSDNPIKFIGLYKRIADMAFILSDEYRLWVIRDSTDFDHTYNPFSYSEFECRTTSGDSIVHGKNGGCKWLALFDGIEDLSFIIDDDTFQISHVLQDTVLILTEAVPYTVADTAYKITADFGQVHDIVKIADYTYISTSRGLAKYDGNDFTLIDTANEPFRYLVDSVVTHHTGGTDIFVNSADSGCGSCSNWSDGQFNGWYMRYGTGSYFQNDGKAKYAQHYFKTLFKIFYTDSCRLKILSNYRNGALYPPEGEFINISKRDPVLASGGITNSSDTEICIINVQEQPDSGSIMYFGVDSNNAMNAVLDSAFFESGDYCLHIDGISTFNGTLFFYGGVPKDTILKWVCYPIVSGSMSALLSVDTVFYFTNKNYHFYRWQKDVNYIEGAYTDLEYYQGRLFYIKKVDPNVVWWSEVGNPDSTRSGSWMKIESNDGDIITRLAMKDERLLAYKKYSTWIIVDRETQFNGIPTYGYEPYDRSRGLVAANTLVDIGGEHYGLGKSGFWGPERILSSPIDDWLEDSLDYEQIREACAEKAFDHIWLSVPKIGQTGNTVTFAYSLLTGTWSRHSFGAAAFAVNEVDNQGYELFISRSDSGKIYKLEGTDDDGDSIVATFQTGYMDFGNIDRQNISRGYTLQFEKPVGCKIETSIFVDTFSAAKWIDTLSSSATKGILKNFCDNRASGMKLSLRLRFFDAAGVTVPWLKWWVIHGGIYDK